ncbi:acidic mammalian chitinase isoform X1 [Fopius arisanus]|uniref:chitinase n=1 Tax=Fopius arisanus TaxID=64838 RepID=A0A9R1TEU5_9HYME|nr:PREDICTED: acidic mammalian chitinase-like isoform X1 [Fopius arisanus]
MEFSIFLVTLSLSVLALEITAEKKVICYFASWSQNRAGKGKFTVADIDASICTHYIWSFVNIEDNKIVISKGNGSNGIREFVALHSRNPEAKLLVAVGGAANSVGANYSKMVSTKQSRNEFIDSAVDVLKEYNLDGLDIDWEYPAFKGGVPSDRENFVLLLKELRERFNQDYLLTVALHPGERIAKKAYDIPGISQHVDFINLMTYNFHGAWENRTGHPSGLHGNGQISVESLVKYWLDKGSPKEKLIVGMTAYGKSWTLSDPNSHGVGANATGVGQPGLYTKKPGTLAYYELCEQINAGKLTVVFDEQTYAPYAYGDNQWVGYEDIRSAKGKASFIQNMGLAGAMLWTIDLDDFRGSCNDKFPLLKSINSILRN